MVAMQERTQIVTIDQSAEMSSSFNIKSHEVFVGVDFPDMDAGSVGLQYTRDGGTNWSPVLDSVSGDDLLVVKSGSDPGIIDISDFVRFSHSNILHKFRFTCAAQTTGAVEIVVLTRG